LDNLWSVLVNSLMKRKHFEELKIGRFEHINKSLDGIIQRIEKTGLFIDVESSWLNWLELYKDLKYLSEVYRSNRKLFPTEANDILQRFFAPIKSISWTASYYTYSLLNIMIFIIFSSIFDAVNRSLCKYEDNIGVVCENPLLLKEYYIGLNDKLIELNKKYMEKYYNITQQFIAMLKGINVNMEKEEMQKILEFRNEFLAYFYRLMEDFARFYSEKYLKAHKEPNAVKGSLINYL